MTGIELVTYATQALYFVVAVYIASFTIRHPRRSNGNILIFFSLLATIAAYSWIQRIVEITPGTIVDALPALLIVTLPYVLLRLARAFSSVRDSIMRLSQAGLIASYVLVIYPGTGNPIALLVVLGYFAAVSVYAASRFHSSSLNANGITQKRMRAVSQASILLGAALFTVVVTAMTEGFISDAVQLMRQLALVASAVLYLIGFAPPAFIRRSWQEPELRNFLRETLQRSRSSATDEVLAHLERTTAETIGAPNAVIGLWNPETELLEFRRNKFKPGETIGGQAFLKQRPILSLDTLADDPDSREIYERGQAFAVIAAPITNDNDRLGVIALYSPNPPIFADDDMTLLGLLADQIAILLENRMHVHAHAELAAREESTRLKDEFLSVAAHDLKTPLTTILGTAQYLERRLASLNEESVELMSVRRLNRESKRLQALVQGLLDASRIEQGQILTKLEKTDLNDLISGVVQRSDYGDSHVLDVDVSGSLTGEFDPVRVQQVIENLIENAKKYSPEGTTIQVSAWNEGDDIRLSVSDQGAGIGPEDLDRVFDRYYRASESSNGSTPGIGLGLHICKEIVEQHGGQIWAESQLGLGSIFHVLLKRNSVTKDGHVKVNSHSR
jgi:signal transduction histidine kinase